MADEHLSSLGFKSATVSPAYRYHVLLTSSVTQMLHNLFLFSSIPFNLILAARQFPFFWASNLAGCCFLNLFKNLWMKTFIRLYNDVAFF